MSSQDCREELPLKWSAGRSEPYVKSVSNAQKKVVFPAMVGKTVITGIADKFDFKDGSRETVEEVIIPEGYQYIGEKAFSDCTSLKEVTLPSTLISLGKSAFSYCPELKSIRIPGSLKTITEFSFIECENLKELIIEDGVEKIETAAFSDCNKLTGVILPDSVKLIEACAFEDCSDLKNVTIPKGAEIEGAAFKGCKKLADKAGMVIMSNVLLDYTGNEDHVVVPEGVCEIGASAFEENKKIKSITIPDSVSVIGPFAFKWCSSLREISIPKGVETIYRYTFCNCQNLNKVVIPDSVTEIQENAFYGCRQLKTVDLPESVQSIGANAFSDQINPTSSIMLVIRNPELVMHKTCLEGCKNFTIYAPEGSPAASFSPSRTRPLQEYDSKE